MNAREFLAMLDILCPIPGVEEPATLDDEPQPRPSRRWQACYGVGDDAVTGWEDFE